MNEIDRDNQFRLDDFIIYEGDDSFCLKSKNKTPFEVLENQTPYVTMRTVLENKLETKGYIFSKYKRFYSHRVDIEKSHFGKVSLFTGRSWDYFKNKIINTYFPTPQTL